MTGASFQRLFDGPLFALASDESPPGWVGFAWTAGAPIPDRIGLRASGGQGHYLFAPRAPKLADAAAVTAYAARIADWVQTHFLQSLACLWLPDADGPRFGEPSRCAIAFGATGSFFTTNGNFNAALGQLTLSVPRGTAFSLDDRALRFSTAAAGRVVFTTSDGRGIPTIDTSALPFLGPAGGSIALSGMMSRGATRGTLVAFEAGVQFCHGRADGTLARQVHPFFQSGDGLDDLAYDGFLDPIDLFNLAFPLSDPAAGRYRTQFLPRGRAASTFVDQVGHALDLVALGGLGAAGDPVAFSAALVPQPRGLVGDGTGAIALAPAGDWALAAPGDDTGKPIRLLPGLYGNESFGLRGYKSGGGFDRLRFEPNQPGRAPLFPLAAATLAAPVAGLGGPHLEAACVTSWGAVLDGPGGATTYAAQPDGAPLYAPAAGAPVMPPLVLSARVPQPAKTLLMPIAPYGGLSAVVFGPDVVAPFESQILAAERKRLLGLASQAKLRSSARRETPASARKAATPQGLLAEIATGADGDMHYQALTLARSIVDGAALDFGFRALLPQLQDLFRTNQLMAVIANPAVLGTPDAEAGQPSFARDVSIAGWRMSAAVGEPGATGTIGNILILKFCDGSLADRLGAPKSWVEAATVSATGEGDAALAVTALSQDLQAYVAAGVAAFAAGDTLYENFAHIVSDPGWRGALVLRAKIASSGLPAQIEGLAAGVDFARFEAHHFGVTASRLVVDGEALDIATPSGLFGLVDYVLPAYRQNVLAGASPDMPVALPDQGDFAFQVLQLQVLFENAGIADFRSRVQLKIGELLGSPVTGAETAIGTLPIPAVVLAGRYQRQGETALYVFEQDTSVLMRLGSDVLPAVALQRIVFNTLGVDADGMVRSRFLIWGTLAFALLAATDDSGVARPIDLLSYGPEPGGELAAATAGLAFSGLAIAMASPIDTPNAVTFSPETGRIALDAAASRPREGSLREDLALEPDGFLSSSDERRPIDFGFLPIDVEVPTKALEGPWCGITYKIDMGSPGALVAKAGFASRLLVAWAPTSKPGDPASALFVGLQLPGAAPGAKLLSIQGVMKLSIDSLKLRKETYGDTRKAFVLRLTDIGLTFLSIIKLPSDPINLFLFGDPKGTGSIGWYAAYREGADAAPAARASEAGA